MTLAGQCSSQHVMRRQHDGCRIRAIHLSAWMHEAQSIVPAPWLAHLEAETLPLHALLRLWASAHAGTWRGRCRLQRHGHRTSDGQARDTEWARGLRTPSAMHVKVKGSEFRVQVQSGAFRGIRMLLLSQEA